MPGVFAGARRSPFDPDDTTAVNTPVADGWRGDDWWSVSAAWSPRSSFASCGISCGGGGAPFRPGGGAPAHVAVALVAGDPRARARVGVGLVRADDAAGGADAGRVGVDGALAARAGGDRGRDRRRTPLGAAPRTGCSVGYGRTTMRH